jgi:adenylylsulfate kinase-like enzyme
MRKSHIYWFIGQPSSGKTTLATYLYNYFKKTEDKVFHIDGDQIRNQHKNFDYSKAGRMFNIWKAQEMAKYYYDNNYIVIVSLVTPFLKIREEFKTSFKNDITEIFMHTTKSRERDKYHVNNFELPKINFIDIDTTIDTPMESFKKLLKSIKS